MELDSLIENIKKNFLELNILSNKADVRIVVGLSGGADSILLYYVLKKISEDLSLDIIPVHINHLIRDSSNQESQKLFSYLKNNFHQRLYVLSVNVPKIAKKNKCSLEEAGRSVRYLLLKNIANIKKAQYIALGHNLDDNVETVIFRMCRGTGIDGLKVMTFVEGNIIRPLIDIRKEMIYEIVRKIGLIYIEDQTNVCLKFTRNRIRHKVLPELVKVNEKSLEHIGKLAKDARDLSNYIETQVKELIRKELVYKDKNIIIMKIPSNTNSYIFKEYIKGVFKLFKGDVQKVKREQIEKFLYLLNKRASFSINFPDDIVFEKGFDFMLIRRKGFKLSINLQKLNEKNLLIADEIGVLKVDKNLEEEVIVRSFEDGDIYKGTKLKKIFQEKKVPKFLRKAIPIVLYENNIIYFPLLDSNSFILKLKDREYKLNFEEGPLYSKINQIFKSQERL